MWTCPRCQRQFKGTNQSHSCVTFDIDDLFEGKPENLLLAFDRLLVQVIDWEPNSLGPTKNAIVFTNKKAWLIVKPMSKELDIKFYFDTVLESAALKKVAPFYGNKYAHHIRISDENQITPEVLRLLRVGFDFALT